ncbi:triphosphoribosyl-dephospho-CoA synthase [Limnoglobus roseus]|uniref:Triphosphoribosyl-dephospho-CoA synthetase n=1 Tax=Limnoglobus roseus TaxID=2598579 RepID=A0A5C1A902_9BACT|nr:triphosphoribosyl-dephospho-CoA synthase [Limnoglobus roseus]QEL15839.1 triphosphoribosyl-dephospho-CoA synthetase [Limnoglobus roseus]
MAGKRKYIHEHAEPKDVQLHIQTACLWEATARKVGNVHRYADFAGTTYLDFTLSAAAVAKPLDRAMYGWPFGRVLLDAVKETRRVCGQNTNLGILLLLLPLLYCDENHYAIPRFIAKLDLDTTKDVFEAIRIAHPGGLGDAAEQDVNQEPTVTLSEAMKLAADRDRIAKQYATGFADVFEFGVPAFLAAFAKFGRIESAVIECQLKWLAAFPDSLIARKNDGAVADDVQRRAAAVLNVGGLDTPEGRRAGVELDAHLRSDGNKLNPGTTADLVTACLFVALRDDKVKPADPFRWAVPDWL